MSTRIGPLFAESQLALAELRTLVGTAPAPLADDIQDVIDEMEMASSALLDAKMAVVRGVGSIEGRQTALRIVRNILRENI